MRISDWSSDVCSSDLKLERSVRLEGRVSKLPREISGRYFHSRLPESQIGAITSRQSRVVRSREALDQRLADAQARRSEERSVGKEWVSTGRSRGSPAPYKEEQKDKHHDSHKTPTQA